LGKVQKALEWGPRGGVRGRGGGREKTYFGRKEKKDWTNIILLGELEGRRPVNCRQIKREEPKE